jgi:hypothetical protein
MIVVAIIAIIASIAIPKLMSARISANENAAIATLRSIASAQAQLQSSCAIDTDADGGGEFGFFGELAGTSGMRIFVPAGLGGAPGLDPAAILDPAILPTAFGDIFPDSLNEGIVSRAGYNFKMFLPDATDAAGFIPGIGEAGTLGIGGSAGAPFPDSNNCEVIWACYAWPIEPESTGNRAFFINQEGDLLQTLNNTGAGQTILLYSGLAAPLFDAAMDSTGASALSGMGANLGIMAQGLPSQDGNIWTIVGN